MPHPRRGYTLIELLVVIAIIAFLLSLVGVVAWRARGYAKIANTKSLIKNIQGALEMYKQHWRQFPSGSPNFPDTWPSPYDTRGTDLEVAFLTKREGSIATFNAGEKDATGTWFVDAWGERIRYRKVGPNTCLVWSTGPNKKDEIGVGMLWNATTHTYGGGAGGGKYQRMGDDISDVESDF